MGKNLYEKVFDSHVVKEVSPGQFQLFVGLHLLHEATSAPAFANLRERGLAVAYPERTFATADHVIPTDTTARPYSESDSEQMVQILERNTKDFSVKYFSPEEKEHGIVHVIGPEKGLTQPGMVICCGDSHTSTHGAFGAIAFGIGTTQVRDCLATQTVIVPKLRVRRVRVTGTLGNQVSAKDLILYVIARLGVKAGIGYAYEFAGPVIERMTMAERMTVCNMSVEAGARCGYINPDQTTFDYLAGKVYSPEDRVAAENYWKSVASDSDAHYDDDVAFNADEIEPMVSWGVSPGQSIGVSKKIEFNSSVSYGEAEFQDALSFMGFSSGDAIAGTPINVAFIGSCTNGRLSDFEAAAKIVKGKSVAPGVKALAVPGSMEVYNAMKQSGLDKVFSDAGFEFRAPGCSMCLAMNTDKLVGREISASSSNRNFKGRQGSATGRTLLMSPVMVAAAAITGRVTDVRKV